MPRMPAWKEKLPLFLKQYEDRLASIGTINSYQQAIELVFKTYAKDLPPNPVNWVPRDVRTVWDRIANMAPASQLHYLTILLLFLRFCGNKNCLDVKLSITPTRTNVDWLSEEQVSLLLSTAPNLSIYAAEVLMAYTGMRRREVATLQTSQLKDTTVSVTGKRRKQRNIPLTPEFWNAMTPYLIWRQANTTTSPFFLLYKVRGGGELRPYQDKTLSTTLILHGKKLGFHLSPHTLRRTFGRSLWKNGCPIELIKEILGHDKIDQTIQYLGINQFDIGEARQFFPRYVQKMYLQGRSQQ